MKTTTIYSGDTCYTRPCDDSNPYREHLELQVLEGGEDDTFFWIADDGNGSSGGFAMEDIDGWSDADINERFRLLDLDVLRDDCTALREIGRNAEADWLASWIDRAEEARDHNLAISLGSMGDSATEDDRERFVDSLRRNGYTWASAADGDGDSSGITEREWQRIMDETFNRTR